MNKKKMLKPQRLYIDTSVIGGCFDLEFEQYSNELFQQVLNGD